MTSLLFLLKILSSGSIAMASPVVLEIDRVVESQKPKHAIATTELPAIRQRLAVHSVLAAWRAARSACVRFGGRVRSEACLRKTKFEVVNVWGGRVGYSAYQATATVSLRCEVEADSLGSLERVFYQTKYSIQEDCPPARTLL